MTEASSGQNAIAAEGMESGMPPLGEHGDHFFGDLAFGQGSIFDHTILKNRLQFLQFKGRLRRGTSCRLNRSIITDNLSMCSWFFLLNCVVHSLI